MAIIVKLQYDPYSEIQSLGDSTPAVLRQARAMAAWWARTAAYLEKLNAAGWGVVDCEFHLECTHPQVRKRGDARRALLALGVEPGAILDVNAVYRDRSHAGAPLRPCTLRRRGARFETNVAGWYFLLDLAHANGWVPAGTAPADEEGDPEEAYARQGVAEADAEGDLALLEDEEGGEYDEDEEEDDEDDEDDEEEDDEEEDDDYSHPVGEEWAEGYVEGTGEVVTAGDAHALAEALENALQDIPDHDSRSHKGEDAWPMPRCMPVVPYGAAGLPPASKWLNALEYFSGRRKKVVQNFIRFARRGAFQIG